MSRGAPDALDAEAVQRLWQFADALERRGDGADAAVLREAVWCMKAVRAENQRLHAETVRQDHTERRLRLERDAAQSTAAMRERTLLAFRQDWLDAKAEVERLRGVLAAHGVVAGGET